MKYTLLAGSAEQFRYTLSATKSLEAKKEVRKILHLPPETLLIPHVLLEGYPKNSVRYRYSDPYGYGPRYFVLIYEP
jgi:hypothetical protein